MPDFIPADIAEQVKTALNDAVGTFSRTFVAERSYADWELPLEESEPAGDAVLVDVVPVPDSQMEIETRGSVVHKASVDIIIRRFLGPSLRNVDTRKYDVAEIDALCKFVQEVAMFFVMAELPNGTRRDEESQPVRRWFVPQHLHKQHQFTAILRVAFERSVAL